MASGSMKVVLAAFGGNAMIALTKFGAAIYTGSSAMLSEAIHSLVDSGNQLLMLLGMKRATRPADEEHPFGYSREIYFWGFVVAILLFSVGAGVSIYEGIQKIIEPHEIESPLVNFIVLGAAILFEGGSFYVALREFNELRGDRPFLQAAHECKDPAIFVVLFEDIAALAGLVIALAGVSTTYFLHMPVFDGIASVAIGLLLGAVAIFLTAETKSLIIGEAASPEVVAGIEEIVRNHPAVVALNDMRTTHLGPKDILVVISVDMRDDLNAAQVEAAITELDQAIRRRFPSVRRLYIEVQNAADSVRIEQAELQEEREENG